MSERPTNRPCMTQIQSSPCGAGADSVVRRHVKKSNERSGIHCTQQRRTHGAAGLVRVELVDSAHTNWQAAEAAVGSCIYELTKSSC